MTSYADERPIPNTTQPLPKNTVVYTLGLAPDAEGELQACFVGDVPNKKPDDDPLTMRIMEDCTVVIQMDRGSYDWALKAEDTITLGANSAYPGDRYYNLTATKDPNGTVTMVSFGANYMASDVANSDPYNLYFLAYLRTTDASVAKLPLEVRIDPDIKNPGDQGG